MGLRDDIERAVQNVVGSNWNIRDGTVVPTTNDIALKNGAVRLEAVYLYADMARSTELARDFQRTTAAKVLRAYLDATCRVIRARGGEIRSFDGDRVMAIFVGDDKNTQAGKAGLQIHYVVEKIVRPEVERRLPSIQTYNFVVSHCVGVDVGTALIVRGGVRGSNDLVSAGRAPNIAAKLSDMRKAPYRTYVTNRVFNNMNMSSKYGGPNNELMWQRQDLTVGGSQGIFHRSNWMWSV